MELTREVLLAATPEEVWDSLAEPEWLGEKASIELRPDGEVRAGERHGFVEEAEPARRLVFWWSRADEAATRVELELEPEGESTYLRVLESRPLAMLDLCGAEFVLAAPQRGTPELALR